MARIDDPVRELVRVGVLAVEESTFLGDEAHRVLAAPADEVAEWTRAGEPCVNLDHLADVLTLGLLRHPVVIDPAVAVAGDLPVAFDHGRNRVRISLERHGDAEDGDRDAVGRKESMESPEADPAPVLVHGLDREVALADPRLREAEFGQKAFGGLVAVENRAFRSLLVVDDELDGDPSVARPPRVRGNSPVSNHVAGIGLVHSSSSDNGLEGQSRIRNPTPGARILPGRRGVLRLLLRLVRVAAT